MLVSLERKQDQILNAVTLILVLISFVNQEPIIGLCLLHLLFFSFPRWLEGRKSGGGLFFFLVTDKISNLKKKCLVSVPQVILSIEYYHA